MQVFFNGEAREIRDEITLAELLADLELSSNRVAVEINLELAPREQHASTVLKEGDRIEVVTLVGGG